MDRDELHRLQQGVDRAARALTRALWEAFPEGRRVRFKIRRKDVRGVILYVGSDMQVRILGEDGIRHRRDWQRVFPEGTADGAGAT